MRVPKTIRQDSSPYQRPSRNGGEGAFRGNTGDAGGRGKVFTFLAGRGAVSIQCLKRIPLPRVRMLTSDDELNAGTAANRVGYESASQYTRGFKRFFGNSPADEATRMRTVASA